MESPFSTSSASVLRHINAVRALTVRSASRCARVDSTIDNPDAMHQFIANWGEFLPSPETLVFVDQMQPGDRDSFDGFPDFGAKDAKGLVGNGPLVGKMLIGPFTKTQTRDHVKETGFPPVCETTVAIHAEEKGCKAITVQIDFDGEEDALSLTYMTKEPQPGIGNLIELYRNAHEDRLSGFDLVLGLCGWRVGA